MPVAGHVRVRAAVTVLVCAVAVILPAPALARRGAASNVGQHQAFAPGAVGGYGQPGVPAPAATPQAVSGSLAQSTGDVPSAVRLQNVCATPPPGVAACAAQALVLRSTGARVRPRTIRFTTPRVRPGAARPTVASPATAPAASPPTAGTPAYLQQAYDLTYLSQSAGHGDTVAIVDAYDDPNAEADLGTFRRSFGLPACTTTNGCFGRVNENGGSAPMPAASAGWAEEESLDVDAVSALCPNCHIRLVEANSASWTDLFTAEATAAALGAAQISNSFDGSSAGALPASDFSFPGVAVVAATGDSGYAGTTHDNYPAALAGVTAAGGTTLTAASGGQGPRGFGESAWSLSGGEGGGSGCDLQVTKPAYQTDIGCTGRSYADVSADANPYTGMAVYDSGAGGWLQAGGTSLSTPLVAAYYALTGVTTSTAQWAYGESALLNDPASGSSGTCAAAISYICNAGVGYDGPTGVGSISGAVAVGGPGIGGPADGTGANNTYTESVDSTAATLTGGVYPNGLDTTWWVEYGTTTAYGQNTAPSDVGAGPAPVSVTGQLTSLVPSTTYHYRLVAQNGSGTTYGYDYTLTTSAAGVAPPSNSAAPTVSGAADQGQTLTAAPGTWSPVATAYAYQWQRSTDGGTTWADIGGATSATYPLGAGDGNAYVRVVVTASNSSGQASATSGSVGPVTSEAPVNVTAPGVTGTTMQGQSLATDPGTWSPAATAYSYQWQRSSDGTTWSPIAGATGATYLLGTADIGAQVRVLVAATNPYGTSATASASSAVGPVVSGAPSNTAAPGDHRDRRAGPHAHRELRHVEPGGRALRVPMAALDRRRRHVGEHLRRDAVELRARARRCGRRRPRRSSPRPTSTAWRPRTARSSARCSPSHPSTRRRRRSRARRSAASRSPPGRAPGREPATSTPTSGSARPTAAARGRTSPAPRPRPTRVAVDRRGRRCCGSSSPRRTTQGTASQASAPTSLVAPLPPANTVAPTVTGAVQRTTMLTATPGTWTGAQNSYAYQWQEDSGEGYADIAGATGLQYTLGTADEGATVRLVVTATNPDGTVDGGERADGGRAELAAGQHHAADHHRRRAAHRHAHRHAGRVERHRQHLRLPVAELDRRDHLDGHRPARPAPPTRSPGPTRARSCDRRDGDQPGRDGERHQRRDGRPCRPLRRSTPSRPTVSGTAQRTGVLSADAGHLDRHRQHLRLPVAALDRRHDLDRHRRSHRHRLHARSDRRGRRRARAGHRHRTRTARPARPAPPPPSWWARRRPTRRPRRSPAPRSAASTLSSTPGTWSGLGNTYAYQWQRSTDGGSTWTAIAGATSPGYMLAVVRRGRDGAPARHRHQRRRQRRSAQLADRDRAERRPREHRRPRGHRHRAADRRADRHAGHLERKSATPTRTSGSAPATAAPPGRPSPAQPRPTYTLGVPDEGAEVRVVVTATNADAAVSAAERPHGDGDRCAAGQHRVAERDRHRAAHGASSRPRPAPGAGSATSTPTSGSAPATGPRGRTSPAPPPRPTPLGAADEGAAVRVIVTATNPDATVSAASAATATVPASPPSNTAAAGRSAASRSAPAR